MLYIDSYGVQVIASEAKERTVKLSLGMVKNVGYSYDCFFMLVIKPNRKDIAELHEFKTKEGHAICEWVLALHGEKKKIQEEAKKKKKEESATPPQADHSQQSPRPAVPQGEHPQQSPDLRFRKATILSTHPALRSHRHPTPARDSQRIAVW